MSSLIDQNDRFAINPTNIRGIQRSKFDMSHSVKTTFNVGQLVPFDCIEVLPGDTFNIETNSLTRLQTLITPIMDDMYLDTYWFFVPNRLVWEHWKEFNGENTKSSWYPTTTYTVPQISIKGTDDLSLSLLDYLGIPTNGKNGSSNVVTSVNALPIRGYNLIWNEWFRDENLQDPILIPTDDSTYAFDKNLSYRGGSLLNCNKYHDYFTSALPSPQKGPDVSIPLLGDAPVYTRSLDVPNFNDIDNSIALRMKGSGTNLTDGVKRILTFNSIQGVSNDGTTYDNTIGSIGEGYMNALKKDPIGSFNFAYPINLWADLGENNVSTINQLRLAFSTQQLYELDARGGTRYTEILKAHFGVTSPDSRQQRPELLSYNHQPINVNQVVQQSQTTTTTALGDVAGLSVTADSDGSFVKSFTEHGFLFGLCAVRYNHSYQQGINRMWSRLTRFDYYWPVFSNIGEQPILNKELYVDWKSDIESNDEVFGYQEAWAEYRQIPNRVSGEMRSDYSQSLDVWHLADDYSSRPYLSNEWIRESPNTVNRVLAVSDNLSAQCFVDFYLKTEATRPMPMYSIPGLTRM